uniref:Putative polygalacturonase n=1 Tax=uncultured microorganism TaxID=358574 RepID=D3JVS9_9ZZZZ|nr:putative polygalacturonase [uncultured microorganism]
MKNVLKYAAIAALCLSAVSLTGCKHEEYDTDQYAGAVALSAVAPNPVMRGGELRILGTNLENVSEVRFAGGITVTDFTVTKSGDHGELRVMVPVEGPEVGKVSIVTKDGTVLESFADLEFTEPIEVASFAPAEVLSGDVVTVKGEYLNNVQEVILGGVYITEFLSKDRHELKFVVPCNAVTGYIIVGDVNELVDPNTIPNQIYSATELVVGDPTVNEAAKATYKSGEVITVTGAHLDMIQKVDLVGAAEVEFSVAEDGKSLSFTLPASATDGAITLTSYAGKTFSAGEIETVTVADLAIKSLAEDGRYKAGCEVEITGADLDLVSKVDFVNASASFYRDGDKIIATLPAAAKDGSVTVTLDSGKQAYTPEIEVVKPVATGVDKTEAVAGKDQVVVSGTDLDLVTAVTIGDKVQSFIPCKFTLNSAEEMVVTIPSAAYTGVLTLTADSGYETVTDEIAVSYAEPVSIVFDQESYELGKRITLVGEHLLQIDAIYVKGKKVVEYQKREDTSMSFSLPEAIASPGVYRLELVLLDGTELTWAVPFTVTAPFTETTIWEGSQIINGWSGVTFGDDRFVWANLGLKEGDVIKIYFTAPEEGWWDLQLCNGHWGNLSIDELDGGNEIKQGAFPGGTQTFSFNVTEGIAQSLMEDVGWGGAFIINGDGNVEVTKISLIQFGASETLVWEGPSAHTGDYALNQELGGEDDWVNAGLYEGAEVRIYFTPDDWSDWSIQIFDGHWNGMGYVTPNGSQWNVENTPDAAKNHYVSFIAEGAAYTALTTKAWWGFAIILQGKNMVFDKIVYL